MLQETALGYFFLDKSHYLESGDPYPIVLGKPLPNVLRGKYDGHYGFDSVLSAFFHANGPVLCCVELSSPSGCISKKGRKVYGESSQVLWMKEIDEKELHKFICICVEKEFAKERATGREPDQRSLAAVSIKREWLEGKTTDRELKKVQEEFGMIKAGAKVRILENSTARTEEERLSRIGKCYFISRVRKWHNQETCFYIKENGCFVGFEEKEIEVVQNYRDFSIEEWENAIKDGFVAQKVLEFSIEEWYNSRNFIAREVLATEIESKSPHIKLGQELRVISVCSDGSNLILCVEDVKGNVFEEWAKYFVITNRTRIEC